LAVRTLENWVVLSPGVPKKLHFKDHKTVSRVITDPVFGGPKTVQSLLLLVDEEDERPVTKTFSVVSEKLAGDLSGYLEGARYRGYRFTLIKDAPGTVPPRILEVTPI